MATKFIGPLRQLCLIRHQQLEGPTTLSLLCIILIVVGLLQQIRLNRSQYRGNSRPQSAVTEKSGNTTKQNRPISAISDDRSSEASDQLYDNLNSVFDSGSKTIGQVPPIHGELSTSGSVLGPLPDISSRKESAKRQKRPTSAGLRVPGAKLGKKKNSRAPRPVSAQARTPIRQHRQATKYSSSRFYMDKAYDDHSISSARSSSTNGDRDSAPTSNSFHFTTIKAI